MGRHNEGKCCWLDERWKLRYLLFLLQWDRMCCVTGMSVSVGLVVVMVSPLFIVLFVNVRVKTIAGGCLLNNVHNFCWAYSTNCKWWPTRCNYLFIPSELYMFPATSSPIIRSTWLYLQFLILTTDIATGWYHGWDGTHGVPSHSWYQPKHVELTRNK